MDNFDYQAYLKSGKIHEESTQVISESQEVTEKKEDIDEVGKGYFKKEHGVGKKSQKESLSETISEAYAKIQEGSYPFDQCLSDNEGKYGVEGAKKVCGAIRAAYGEGLVKEMDEVSWNEKNNPTRNKAVGERDPKKVGQSTAAYAINEEVTEGNLDDLRKLKDNLDSALSAFKKKAEELKLDVSFGDATQAVNKYIDDVFKADSERTGGKIDENEEATSKMKVSELKDKIKEDIIEFLSEQEEDVDVDVEDEVEADVDVDVEDDVNVDAEGDEVNIKKKAVKADIEVGLSPTEELVQDSLEAAMKASEALGNQTLTDQIGNTITYFTREFVVGRNTD